MQGEEFARYLDGDLLPRLSATAERTVRGFLFAIACAVATASFAAPTNIVTAPRKTAQSERGTAFGCVSSYDETVSLWTTLPGDEPSAGKGSISPSANNSRVDAPWELFRDPTAGGIRSGNCRNKPLTLSDVGESPLREGELFSPGFPPFPYVMMEFGV